VRGRVRAGVVAALAVTASPLAGQQLSVRLGGVRARYADAVYGSAGVLTTRLAWDAPRFLGTLDGSFAQFSGGRWAAQAGGSFYGIRLVGPKVGLGIRGDAEGGVLGDGVWSGVLSAGPVASVLAGAWVLSAGVAAGAVRRIDSSLSGTVIGSVRARADAGPWSISGELEATRTRTFGLADATLEAAFRTGPLGLSALAGGRTGGLGGKPWYQGRVNFRATPWATLEAQAGSYPRDLSGFYGGSFVSFGVWLRPWPRASTITGRPAFSSAAASVNVVVEPIAPGRERVTFVVPGAEQVAIAGEWNDWRPVALVRLGPQRWRADVALGRGAHRFSLVVDGARWMVPPGVPSLPDSFGGTVGLLVIDE
jgi:hypothetical protein